MDKESARIEIPHFNDSEFFIDYFDAGHICMREKMSNGIIRTIQIYDNTHEELHNAEYFLSILKDE